MVFPPDDEPLPNNRKTGDIERDHSAFLKFHGHGVRRDESDPETGDDRLLDGLVAAHLHADLRLKIAVLKKLFHEESCTRARLAGNEPFVRQIDRRKSGRVCKPVSCRRDDDMRMVADQMPVQFDIGRWVAHDCKIERIAKSSA